MFDLTAKNREVGDVRFSWLIWREIIEHTGAGYVLGCGFFDDDPGKYIYDVLQDNCGSPMSNDGYGVTEFEAKCMAACCAGYVRVRRAIKGDDAILQEIERFASFAAGSGGFTIN
ncbi:MAG: hypothetical protein LBK58_09035 [Prevotellaceae bacterium]|jgi:hypothetical protein|nr:hypothetical protein [Prevotellaceae bacterium]